MKGNR